MKVNKILMTLMAAVLLPAAIAACKTDVSEPVNTDKDQPERVIALSRSNADLWILAGGKLVATSDDAMDITGLNDDAVSLGDMDHVSLEAVTQLDPDMMILFSTDPAQKALGEACEEAGIPVTYTNIDSFADYDEVMKEFTTLTKREDLYEKNVTDIQKEIDEIKAECPKPSDGSTYLLLHVSATKSKVEKNDYFASEIFTDLGLVNIADDSSAFNDLSTEAVVTADPDYVFVVPRGNEKKAMDSFDELFTSDPAWASLTAVQNGHVYLLDKEMFGLKPNAQWAEAYRQAYDLLYGDR